jgi:hypothetical protein
MAPSASPVTEAEKAWAARRLEIKEALKDPDLTLPGFCLRAFEFPETEVKDLDYWKATDQWSGAWSKLQFRTGRGYDFSHIDDVLIAKFKPGLFLVGAIGKDSRWIHRRPFTCGNPDEVPRPAPPAAREPERTDLSLRRELGERLKDRLERTEVRRAIREDEAEDRREQLEPLKLFTEMQKAMSGANPDRDRFLEHILKQNAELQNLILTKLVNGGGGRDDAPAPVAMVGQMRDVVQSVRELAPLLGLQAAEGAAPATDWMTPMLSVVDRHLPTILDTVNGITGAFRAKMGHAGRGTVPAGSPDGGAPALAPGEKGAAVGQAMNPAILEAAGVLKNALRSKNFPTVYALYGSLWRLTNGILPELDPSVDPAAYIAVAKLFDPEFDKLRGEWALFLQWVRDQEAAEADAGAAAGPGAGAPADLDA